MPKQEGKQREDYDKETREAALKTSPAGIFINSPTSGKREFKQGDLPDRLYLEEDNYVALRPKKKSCCNIL